MTDRFRLACLKKAVDLIVRGGIKEVAINHKPRFFLQLNYLRTTTPPPTAIFLEKRTFYLSSCHRNDQLVDYDISVVVLSIKF